jgi:hypothetical protein
VLRRHVERFEVVVVVFDLRALEHLVAEAREDLAHLLAHQAERMAMSERAAAAGQRDVHRPAGRRVAASAARARVERGLHLALQLVGAAAEGALLVGRGLADRAP